MDEIRSSSTVFGGIARHRSSLNASSPTLAAGLGDLLDCLTENKLLPLPPVGTVEPQTKLIGWNDAVLTSQGEVGRLRCVNSPQPKPNWSASSDQNRTQEVASSLESVSVGHDWTPSPQWRSRGGPETPAHRCWFLCRVQ